MKVTRVEDRKWESARFDPKASKVTFYDGRENGGGRTLLSKYLSGQCVAPQTSSAPWDIFVIEGDLTVNGALLTPGDHVLCEANESIEFSSMNGCVSLIFVRANHEWIGLERVS